MYRNWFQMIRKQTFYILKKNLFDMENIGIREAKPPA